MNNDPNDVKNGELDQTRLTAYALEQLEGAERAAVEALLAGSDQSRHTVDEIRALAAEVKKVARQEAPAPRSPELRAALEQYLGNPEVAEMDAKPKPSSAKAPRHGRRRSKLLWAAAVCALAAAIPGYVLVSGSMRQTAKSVALDHPSAETPTDSFPAVISTDDVRYEESDESLSAVSKGTGRDLSKARIVGVSAEGESLGVTAGKRQQPADEASVLAIGETLRQAPAEPPAGRPSEPTSAPYPAEPKLAEAKERNLGVAAGQEPTVGKQTPDNYSFFSPFSRGTSPTTEHVVAQPPQAGSAAYPKAPAGRQETDHATSLESLTQSLSVPEAAAPIAGEKAGMMGGMGAGMGSTAEEAPMEMGVQDSDLFNGGMQGMGMPGMMMGKPATSAPSDMPGMSGMGGMGGMPMINRVPRLADVELKAYARPASPGEIETLPDLDVIILKGNAKDAESVRRLIEQKERRARRPMGIGAGSQYNRLSPGTEQYDPIVENPFLSAAENPQSTFSVDVDTASYANVRRFLDSGRLPPPNAVRIEELINYFRYDYPQPDDEVPFSVNMETAQCPWDTEHRLVRIGLKGREIDPQQRGPGNLVFLLDVSGSMRDENKLPLVQYAMGMLVDQLTEDDRVAIVTYAGEAGVALESTSGEKRKKIRRAIDNLSAGGSTHGSAGIVMAYDQAMQHFVENGTNRVILCTDGDLNVGITDDDELVKLISEQATSGVFLTVLGFGSGNLKDSKMEKLADKGNGIYAYVDGRREARRVLVEQVAGSLVTIAKDVKVQIEFNPAEVAGYRLIGYENRIMAAADFANDKKDAGEIGAGHTVTALYEIVPGGTDAGGELGRELKYQRKTGRELTEAAASGELFTLALRYKEPEGEKSKLLEFVQKDSDKDFGQSSADFRFAASVAAFGMLLRGSEHAGDLDWSAAEELAAGSLGDDPGGYRNEFLELIHRAGELRSR